MRYTDETLTEEKRKELLIKAEKFQYCVGRLLDNVYGYAKSIEESFYNIFEKDICEIELETLSDEELIWIDDNFSLRAVQAIEDKED